MAAKKIRMKIEKTGNQEYDFLIEKGLLCVGDLRTNYDARDAFKKATKLVLYPAEAYFGLMLCDLMINLDSLEKQDLDNVINNENYILCKKFFCATKVYCAIKSFLCKITS